MVLLQQTFPSCIVDSCIHGNTAETPFTFVLLYYAVAFNILFPGRKGRPDIDITHDQLKLLHRKGYTARQMAAVFKCSTQLVYKRLYASGIRQRNKYASIGTSALQQLVTEIHKDHPESGCKVSRSEIHLLDCFQTFIS
jgi:hypothetical protein